MMKEERGQVIILTAVLLIVLLLLLSILIDGAHYFIEKQETNRALDAAGKAGLIVVSDRMVTQAVSARTAAGLITNTSNPPRGTSFPITTGTPEPDAYYPWLTDQDRQTLVAPPLQTVVATHVLGSLAEMGLGPTAPNVLDIRITYPVGNHSHDPTLGILLELDRRVAIVFSRILTGEEGVITGRSKQIIPHH